MKTVFSMRSIPTTDVPHAEGQKLNDTKMGFSEAVWDKKSRGTVSTGVTIANMNADEKTYAAVASSILAKLDDKYVHAYRKNLF